MSDRIAAIIEGVIEREGGFVDNPDDRGGATRYGITENTARRSGYAGPMVELPRAVAQRIYREQYVEQPGFAQVLGISAPVAEELVDTGVLMGPGTATKFLQRALNAFNRGGQDYADLTVDGGCGPASRSALSAFLAVRGAGGERVLAWTLNAIQADRLLEIAERDPRQESFVYGQIAHRAAGEYV